MRLSNFFLPLLKETTSKDEEVQSYKLMIRAGLIRKVDKGLYTWLPIGLRIIEKIIKIIDTVMEKYEFQKIAMPCVQPASLWIESGRYDAYGAEMLKITDRHEKQFLFGPTHEEIVSDLVRKNPISYKNYPIFLYQITTKFRDEIRPRFGVMRSREFLMKDGYSFDISVENSIKTYYKVFDAYEEIFAKLGLNVFAAAASNGAIGGDMSHEFHILSDVGESTLYLDEKFFTENNLSKEEKRKLYCATDEKHAETSNSSQEHKLFATDEKHEEVSNNNSKYKLSIDSIEILNNNSDNNKYYNAKLVSSKSIEIGHIFNFGTKYSASMNVSVQNDKQERILLEMGSYGIGISRLVAAIIERHDNITSGNTGFDSKGIIWPEQIAPFLISIINLSSSNICESLAAELYTKLKKYEVLFDDTNNSNGQKLAIHNLIGIPYHIIINEKNILNNQVEIRIRKTQKSLLIDIDKIEEFFLIKLI
ncbi:MAG: proline--tRNA ligase [Rickettsiales bacterium]